MISTDRPPGSPVTGTRRTMDIEPIAGELVEILVDGEPVIAAEGETVLAALTAAGVRLVARDDRGRPMGAFCAMGVCYCCTVKIDDVDKQRSCQTIVEPGMRVVTLHNRHSAGVPEAP
jgi:hydrogen cyanide synthase HcnA